MTTVFPVRPYGEFIKQVVKKILHEEETTYNESRQQFS